MERQSPLPKRSRPTRKSLCSSSLHGMPRFLSFSSCSAASSADMPLVPPLSLAPPPGAAATALGCFGCLEGTISKPAARRAATSS
eukprot:4583632-Prymnesium_polylepis.1